MTALVAVAAFALATAQDVRWERAFADRPIAVGATARLELVARHADELDAELDAGALGEAWLLVDASPPRRVDEEGPLARTAFTLAVAPLATGLAIDAEGRAVATERLALDGIAVRFVSGGGGEREERARVVAPPLEAPVADPVPADRTAPPPPRGLDALDLPALPPPPWYARPAVWIALAAALVALAALAWRRRRARRTAEAREPTPVERAEAAIAALSAPDAAARRAALFELVAAVRAAIDRQLGVERAALTEEDWLAATTGDARAAIVADRLTALSQATWAARWRGDEPSAYALDGIAGGARAVLAALGSAPAHAEGRAA